MTPTELATRRGRGERLVVLDVREDDELLLAALEDVVHVPLGELVGRVEELDPAAETVVVCHHGIRSARAAGFLASRGFERVWNLAGGIDRWSLEVDSSLPRY
ncbi:MAG: rhodanese-like domain-containing protein [Planctomycetota bacterium]